MRVRSCLSLCISVPVSLCPFCHPSSSRHGYLIYFGSNFVYVYDCVIVSFLLLLVISVSGGHFSVILAARMCVWAWVRVCVLQSLDIGISLSMCERASTRGCVCVCVCSPIHSDIISDWKQAFSRDGRTAEKEPGNKLSRSFYLLVVHSWQFASWLWLWRLAFPLSRLAIQMLWLLFLLLFRCSSVALN